jgi:ATP-binding cassette subfamily A (ABC1) protein 3
VANSILRVKSGNPNAQIGVTFIPFKTDKYVDDDFALIFSNMMPFFMLLIYILPMYRLLSNIVSEKETKARESMKMMGLVDFSYWLSWWVYYFIIVTIISALCILVLSFNVIKYSNRGLVFVFFELFGLSLFGLAVFLQSFFSRARVAAITGTLIYFGTSFINVVVQDPSVSAGPKSLASLLTTIAISRGCNNLGMFETSGTGLQVSNLRTQYQNYAMGTCFSAMIISLLLFFWVGIWLDNVLPSAYGLRKGWCFCLSPHFWCGRSKNQKVIRRNTVDAENGDDERYFEAKYMKKENYEPVSRDLVK